MNIQRRDDEQPFERAREGAVRSDGRVDSVRNAIMGMLFPAPAAPEAENTDFAQTALSVATVLIVIVLAAGGAAAVAAKYGPVFAQPMMGP